MRRRRCVCGRIPTNSSSTSIFNVGHALARPWRVFMPGTIVQINISPGGLPKRAVSGGLIAPLGIEGDRHAHPGIHGGLRQAILLIAAEVVEELQRRSEERRVGKEGRSRYPTY